MPKVIVDTSTIQYLYQIGQFQLLYHLYGEILVPQAVRAELKVGREQGILLPELMSLSWCIEPSPVQVQRASEVILNSPGLGYGECEVLCLACCVTDPLVIMDDRLGREWAKLNIPLTGTLGVLLKGKQNGLLEGVAPLLDDLNRLGFRLDPATRQSVMKLANE